MDESIERCLSITCILFNSSVGITMQLDARTYCASICWNNHTWITCQSWVSDSTDRTWTARPLGLYCHRIVAHAGLEDFISISYELSSERFKNLFLLISYPDWFLRLLCLWHWTDDQSDINQASWYKLIAKLNVTLWQHRKRSTLTLTQGLSASVTSATWWSICTCYT